MQRRYWRLSRTSTEVLIKLEQALNHLAENLRESIGAVDIYLFGSFARGDWLEDSDVDIVVVSERFEGISMSERINSVRKLATRSLAFEILAYTPKELKEALERSLVLQDASTYWRKIT